MDQNQPADNVLSETPKLAKNKASPLIGPIILIVTLLICFAGTELVAYIWEVKTAQDDLGWTLVGARRLKLERHGDPNNPYYLMTPNKTYNWEGISVEINDNCLRGPDFEHQKSSGTTRILNLGDSIVFGWEVKYEDTYGVQLAHLLQSSGLDVEVINAGVPTWNLESERNYLLQEGLNYQPDLVILDLTLVNDIYGKGPTILENPSITEWLRDQTYFWPFLTTQARFFLARQRGPEAFPVLNPPKNAESYFPTQYNSTVWDSIWSYIDEMAAACRAQDTPFIVIVFPTALQVNNANHTDIPQKVFIERVSTSGISLIDLLPVYKDICSQAEPGACDGYVNILFADVWMHPNDLGHRLAAEALLPEVQTALGLSLFDQ